MEWMNAPFPGLAGYAPGYYYAIARDQEMWVNQSAIQIVYLYYDGQWRVCRHGSNEAATVESFSHWMGPMLMPAIPLDIPQ